jgi:hypothetical protein
VFTTKQRLVSHLTRVNKCYDINEVGIPPLLLEIMGASQKTTRPTPTLTPTPTPTLTPTPTPILTPTPTPQPLKKNDDDQVPVIFKSKREHRKPNKIVRKIQSQVITVTKEEVSCQPDIKYIVKENYVNYLATSMGSMDNALKFVRSCIQSKIKGGISLLYKIYFEGKDQINYPIEIVDLKNMKIYYKTPERVVLDEKSNVVKSILIDNLRNCYLQFCNRIINANMDDNDIIFDNYDLRDIQNHILDLSDDKLKDRIVHGLLEQIKTNKK